MSLQAHCPLCTTPGGRLIWRDAMLRVVHVDEPGFPGFYRVIANAHVGEWSDLSSDERQRFMGVVVAVEEALREVLTPTKINLAALGNMVPHLHWHVIARFEWDSHFPQSVWGTKQRESDPAKVQQVALRLGEVEALLRAKILSPAEPDATAT